jgi:maleylpyruvate isomerase
VPADVLRDDCLGTEARLAQAVAVMPEEAWASVRNGQGRMVAAREIPWMRAKEVWVHGIDLAAGVPYADAPADFWCALVDDVFALFASRDQLPHLTIRATDIGRT